MEEYRNNTPVSSLKQQMYRAYGVLGVNKNDNPATLEKKGVKNQLKQLSNMRKFYSNR